MGEILETVEAAARAIAELEPENWGPWVVGLLKMLDERAREKGLEPTFSDSCLAYVMSSGHIRQSTGGWG
jgi:hypothetical protein